MYHQRWPYAIVWHLVSKMELLCVWVKKPAQFLGPGSSLRFLVPCDCFYSLILWRLSQSLWHVDAVFVMSRGNNIPVFFQQLFQTWYLNSYTFIFCVQTWQWNLNLSTCANSWPGKRTQDTARKCWKLHEWKGETEHPGPAKSNSVGSSAGIFFLSEPVLQQAPRCCQEALCCWKLLCFADEI